MEVDWADLVTLDLSQFEKPGGKERLAKQLQEAIQKIGKLLVSSFLLLLMLIFFLIKASSILSISD